MEVEETADLVRCPSCHEEVPKTLYCLNCGYPLYKVEFEEGGGEVPEKPEEVAEEVKEVEEVPEEGVEEVIEAEEAVVEMEAEVEGEVEEVPEEVEEEEPLEAVVEEPEAVEAVEVAEEEAEEAEAVEEVEEVEEVEVFTPPPPLEEVMREVAKNLSIRMRMVRMLLRGELREEAFNRMLDHYRARGERWLSEWRGLMERRRMQLEELEEGFMEAKMRLEELEVRRAIGDASEEEYEVKAPAYRWDVDKLGGEMERIKAEMGYLSDLPGAMGIDAEELGASIEELMEGLRRGPEEGSLGDETAERAKVALEEILNTLKV